jgi:hypothetical protein
MIRRLYDGYVDRVAAERGVWAFFKWFVIGFVLQVAFMIPALPLLVLGVVYDVHGGLYFSAVTFIVAFLSIRVFLFALPCRAVAERKRLPSPLGWAAGGMVFGQIALGLAAALAPAETATAPS